MSKSNSGQEIGEAALFESAYRRHATTRCSQHCETLMCLDWDDVVFNGVTLGVLFFGEIILFKMDKTNLH